MLSGDFSVDDDISSTTIEFRRDAKRIASHARCYSLQQKNLDLEHYLDVLGRKPGALRGSTPLAQWRALGRWPISYDRIWERLIERQGRQPGTRAMVELVRIGREAGYGKLTAAIEEALDLGCADVAAIRHLMMSDQLSHTVGEAVDIGSLSAYERPLPTMIEYDQLGSVERCGRRKSKPWGVRFCFRSALRATLQQNRAPPTSTSHRVGQNKPPKWAKPSCQSHLELQGSEMDRIFLWQVPPKHSHCPLPSSQQEEPKLGQNQSSSRNSTLR